ncbi:hypothetical protein [Streptomyces sp. NBC_01285]|uniref:hypothetical protein n=1 Tax=Streptomyces sp. NBC_01285 TaxID=2903813 RepID=UPI00225061F2|nr:hypothetical protein [Streptomyces sp. NBC_01285]MCX4774031.1 hypothetical protein [Streptomyces sp. NBC_01285]
MDYTKPTKSQCAVSCPQCGADVAQTLGRGRIKQFCSPSHGRSWRTRMRSAGWL